MSACTYTRTKDRHVEVFQTRARFCAARVLFEFRHRTKAAADNDELSKRHFVGIVSLSRLLGTCMVQYII